MDPALAQLTVPDAILTREECPRKRRADVSLSMADKYQPPHIDSMIRTGEVRSFRWCLGHDAVYGYEEQMKVKVKVSG